MPRLLMRLSISWLMLILPSRLECHALWNCFPSFRLYMEVSFRAFAIGGLMANPHQSWTPMAWARDS